MMKSPSCEHDDAPRTLLVHSSRPKSLLHSGKLKPFLVPPLKDRILKRWFAVSPSRILDPLGVARKAKKNRHSAIHLIQQFLLGQATHLLNELLDLSSVVLVRSSSSMFGGDGSAIASILIT